MRQLIGAAPDTADLREFAEPARRLLGPGYRVHWGNSHVWIKRDDAPKHRAGIAAYKKWFFSSGFALTCLANA